MHRLKIAIISDLHCHPKKKKDEGPDHTYLLSDKLRTPSNDHPVESLLPIIRDNSLTADLTLCPGDFTDQANVAGFIAGWNFSLEIHRELHAKKIIATLGNHDVDSYNGFSDYSLKIAKGIKQGFPFNNEQECDIFWSKGCVFVEGENFRVLVINSSHYHHSKQSATAGKVDGDLIEYIEKYLAANENDKILIALSHHHPIDHSRMQLGEDDKIVNGDELLNVLGKHKFDLFIHGHKHDPLLRYHNTSESNYRIPIFSAGSFSSSSNLMFTSVRNSFHMLDIEKDCGVAHGEIKTWTFFPNRGWELNLDENGFAPYSGFGNQESIDEIYQKIVKLFMNSGNLSWDFVRQNVKEIDNLIPSDAKKLSTILRENKYYLDEHIWKRPSQIFKIS